MAQEVTAERNMTSAQMRHLAIHSTEQKLNEMRRGHVEELENVVSNTITRVFGSLKDHDGNQIEQLRLALDAKRDEMITNARDEIYAQLEVALRTMEMTREGSRESARLDADVKARAELERRLLVEERAMRMEIAKRELAQTVETRRAMIEETNNKEKVRVFGELAQALEVGATRNLDDLRSFKENETKTKEAHLVAHSEKVVNEAMEKLAGELLEAERIELHEIKSGAEEERVNLMSRTRLEGGDALVRAVETEKERLRKKKDDAVDDLRQELQRKAMDDLQELTDALESDLKSAEKLMVDSVKGGLASALQGATEEHAGRQVVDEHMLETLQRKLKVRTLALVKEFPKFVEAYRLRVFGQVRGGSAEFEMGEGDLNAMEEHVGAGRTGMALHVLQELYEKLGERQESVTGVLADVGVEIRALRKELKEVDADTYDLYYKGTGRENPDESTGGTKIDVVANILADCFRTVDRASVGRGERLGEDDVGIGESTSSCLNCQKLYRMNGELLKEINE
jgi:hypothetical protein